MIALLREIHPMPSSDRSSPLDANRERVLSDPKRSITTPVSSHPNVRKRTCAVKLKPRYIPRRTRHRMGDPPYLERWSRTFCTEGRRSDPLRTAFRSDRSSDRFRRRTAHGPSETVTLLRGGRSQRPKPTFLISSRYAYAPRGSDLRSQGRRSAHDPKEATANVSYQVVRRSLAGTGV
jgi:hypothetical protein